MLSSRLLIGAEPHQSYFDARTLSKYLILKFLVSLESAELGLSKDTSLVYFEGSAGKLTFLEREILIFSELNKLIIGKSYRL
jgi:hypothetical protein